MSAAVPIPPEHLINSLRLLCAQPASAGNMRDLEAAADLVADLICRAGLEAAIERGDGAPVVVGWRAGHSPFTLLLYHHYDVAPPGPWRAWSHEPFQLAERDHALYGRGVAHGKGALIAHLQALSALLRTEGELPCSVVLVVEGEALTGSPHLASVIAAQRDRLRADACLGSGGERDSDGHPFCYSGSKGLLQARLTARSSTEPLLPGMATTVRNPVWRLVWALNCIKGEDEEVRITGFYDKVTGPSRSDNAMLRKIHLDEVGRLAAWQIPEFLFGMSGPALIQAEVTLPTCNLSTFTTEPQSDLPAIPAMAHAQLDFQLVPQQQPQQVLELLREHLIARNFADIAVSSMPGSYSPVQTAPDHPFLQQLAETGTQTYGRPLTLLPFGPFTQPLHLFATQMDIPVASLALARHNSAVRSHDENLPLDDLLRHSAALIELLRACGKGYPHVAEQQP